MSESTSSVPDESHDAADRRSFLGSTATVAMAGGLAAGYGSLGSMAVRFLFTQPEPLARLFVSDVASFAPGSALEFTSPTGVRVTVKRTTGGDAATPQANDFIALSSVCPHLGCRVHWEGANKRFFCPCHNGEFDPEGRPTGGPPLAANQPLPRYPLVVENGLLFIDMPAELVGQASTAAQPKHSGEAGA